MCPKSTLTSWQTAESGTMSRSFHLVKSLKSAVSPQTRLRLSVTGYSSSASVQAPTGPMRKEQPPFAVPGLPDALLAGAQRFSCLSRSTLVTTRKFNSEWASPLTQSSML